MMLTNKKVLDTYCPCCGHRDWEDSLDMPAEDANGPYTRCMPCHDVDKPRNPNVKPWADLLQQAAIREQGANDDQLSLL